MSGEWTTGYYEVDFTTKGGNRTFRLEASRDRTVCSTSYDRDERLFCLRIQPNLEHAGSCHSLELRLSIEFLTNLFRSLALTSGSFLAAYDEPDWRRDECLDALASLLVQPVLHGGPTQAQDLCEQAVRRVIHAIRQEDRTQETATAMLWALAFAQAGIGARLAEKFAEAAPDEFVRL